MKEAVIITFEKLFDSDNRLNIAILKSTLKETMEQVNKSCTMRHVRSGKNTQ